MSTLPQSVLEDEGSSQLSSAGAARRGGDVTDCVIAQFVTAHVVSLVQLLADSVVSCTLSEAVR